MRPEGLDQIDLRAIIILGRRLDIDVDIGATNQGEFFAFVRRPEATFFFSRNSDTYHMINSAGHVVAEADNIREILAVRS